MTKPLAERFQSTLRDCALSGYQLMLILTDGSKGADDFANEHYISFENNKEVYGFMQLVVSNNKDHLEPATAAFLEERHWSVPSAGHVIAFDIDANGNELVRQEIAFADKNAAESSARFIHQHALAADDAVAKWTAAFAEANRTNRRVWVRVSQRYCGPCFRLTRWLADQQKLLEKDYVMLKIDDFHDEHGKEVAQRVTDGREFGIPFHAIFDTSGKMIIDSNGPLGNVGYPSGFDGKKQLRKMLQTSRQNLTDAEIEQLIHSLPD